MKSYDEILNSLTLGGGNNIKNQQIPVLMKVLIQVNLKHVSQSSDFVDFILSNLVKRFFNILVPR